MQCLTQADQCFQALQRLAFADTCERQLNAAVQVAAAVGDIKGSPGVVRDDLGRRTVCVCERRAHMGQTLLR